MKRLTLCAMAALSLGAASAFARPVTPQDLVSLRRITGTSQSPDGATLVYALRETDLAANKGRTALWVMPAKGGAPKRLTDPADSNAGDPQIARDGHVYYLRTRDAKAQVWRVPLSGGAPSAVTETGASLSGFRVNPDGDRLVVWADLPNGASSLAAVPQSRNSDSARAYDQLFVRHWDAWTQGQRSQLFVAPLIEGRAGKAVPVAPQLLGDAPSKPFGGVEEIAWAPDGRTLYFTLREAGRIEALSTNLDIFAWDAATGGAPVNLTMANTATDTLPTPSPDGTMLAYAAMKRPGYEADRLGLMLRDRATGQTRPLAAHWDRSVDSIAWTADGTALLVTARERFDGALFRIEVKTGKVTRLTADGSGSVHTVLPQGDGTAIVAIDSLVAPADLYRLGRAPNSPMRPITRVNADRLIGVEMPKAHKFSFAGANGDTVWAYMLAYGDAPQPPRSLPMAFLVHGGPQSSFGNGWSYRWNPAVFAGHGLGVVLIDFHGSTGYGQPFTDSIHRDWGGKPLTDLKAGFAAAVARYPALDPKRACAAGGSYGGYMMNWIAGRWPEGFRCLINHAGVFDLRGMAFETDELWFDEWDQGGPWWARADAERWNPVNHVQDWKTPTLVIHGEQDFRVPVSQGLSTFTALQRQDIPSRLVVFPDENHWILKPSNSLRWYREVFDWIDRWTAPGARP